MRILIIANAEQEEEIRLKNTNQEAALVFKNELPELIESSNFNAFFILTEISHFINFSDFGTKPVFINSVIDTLTQLQLPNNVSRINAWPGFLQREIWEVASENKNETRVVFNSLGWTIIFVKDEPGLVAARVISMIVNEAFFALEGNVSTKEEIDLAMKLGTNYPFGPFEWSEEIGIKNIFSLLQKLSQKDVRYLPSSAFENYI